MTAQVVTRLATLFHCSASTYACLLPTTRLPRLGRWSPQVVTLAGSIPHCKINTYANSAGRLPTTDDFRWSPRVVTHPQSYRTEDKILIPVRDRLTTDDLADHLFFASDASAAVISFHRRLFRPGRNQELFGRPAVRATLAHGPTRPPSWRRDASKTNTGKPGAKVASSAAPMSGLKAGGVDRSGPASRLRKEKCRVCQSCVRSKIKTRHA